MATAKDIHVAPISQKDAATLVKKVHYSGKIVNNSQLHFGVFLNGKLEGVMSFGASMYKGISIKRVTKAISSDQLESGGAVPTDTLHSKIRTSEL